MIPVTATIVIFAGANFKVTFYLTDRDGKPTMITSADNVSAGIRPGPQTGTYRPFHVMVSNPYITLLMTANQTKLLRPGTHQFDVLVNDELYITGRALVQSTVVP